MAQPDINKVITMEILPLENDLLASSWVKTFVSLIWSKATQVMEWRPFHSQNITTKNSCRHCSIKQHQIKPPFGSLPRTESYDTQSQSASL